MGPGMRMVVRDVEFNGLRLAAKVYVEDVATINLGDVMGVSVLDLRGDALRLAREKGYAAVDSWSVYFDGMAIEVNKIPAMKGDDLDFYGDSLGSIETSHDLETRLKGLASNLRGYPTTNRVQVGIDDDGDRVIAVWTSHKTWAYAYWSDDASEWRAFYGPSEFAPQARMQRWESYASSLDLPE
jgi:hypothetical protein